MNRQLWFEQMKKYYPNVPDYVIKWMLDIYDVNPEFYNKRTGKKGRPKKQKVLFEIEKILQDRPQTQEIQSVKVLPAKEDDVDDDVTPQIEVNEVEVNENGIICM